MKYFAEKAIEPNENENDPEKTRKEKKKPNGSYTNECVDLISRREYDGTDFGNECLSDKSEESCPPKCILGNFFFFRNHSDSILFLKEKDKEGMI
jgi:hypothetical protein